MYVGRVNTEAIDIDTNVVNLNPLISSAMLLPLADYKSAYKLNIPQEPASVLTMSHGYEYFCQFLMKGPVGSPPKFQISWDDRHQYEIPSPGDGIALKIDGVISLIAYELKKEDNKLLPFAIAYSDKEYNDLKFWLERIDMPKTPVILVNYEKFGSVAGLMERYENWLAATVAANKSSLIWYGIPRPEISNYIPDRAQRLFEDGSDWLTKGLGRSVIMESAFTKNKTRTELVGIALDHGVEATRLVEAMRCKCGACFECFMNFIAFKNNNIKAYEFKDAGFVKRLTKLIEFGKLDQELVKEIEDHITH